MTARGPCPPAPGPLEDYARQFDDCFGSLAQRRASRGYLGGLLLPRDRHRTLTALAGTEPVVGAQHPGAQRLQFFLPESIWEADTVNARRLALVLGDAATAPHAQGVLLVDDTGDRKAGCRTAHVARQYLGSVGKIDSGIVAVTTLWADERVYYPLHVVPYTPASRLPTVSAIRRSTPNRSLPSDWSPRRRRSPSPSGRWRRTASMATISASRKRCGPPTCRSCWRSSRPRAGGRVRVIVCCWVRMGRLRPRHDQGHADNGAPPLTRRRVVR